MAAVIVARRHGHNERVHRDQVFHQRVNIFERQEKIIQPYRLGSYAILGEVAADHEPVARRSHATPAMTKLPATSHFLV